LNRYNESRTDSKAISIEVLYNFFKATNSFDEIDECGENENVIFCMNDAPLFSYNGFIIPTVQHSGKNPESKTKLKSLT
jgi:hypothetical protein